MKEGLLARFSAMCSFGALLLIVFALTPSSNLQCAYACSCEVKKPVPQALSEAKAVFLGNVTDTLSTESGSEVRFEVQKAWKGIEDKIVTISASEGTCSFGFIKGKQYLVYAYNQNIDHSTGTEQEPVVLATNICLRTALAEDAGADYALLGDGYVPIASFASPEFTPYERGILVGGIDRITLFTLIGVCATIAVGFVVIKKTRHKGV